jgi:hypothetical protein
MNKYKLLISFIVVFSYGCGGSGIQSAENIPDKIDLGQSCKYIGENRFLPSLNVFCSQKDFYEIYPESNSNGKSYFNLNNRDVLIASFIGFNFIDNSNRFVSKHGLQNAFYQIMGGRDYSANSLNLRSLQEPCKKGAEVFTVDTQHSGLQLLYEYCSSHSRKENLAVIYLEGHGGSAIDIGVDHMNFLASQGYRVFYSDMPLTGSNENNLIISHNDLGLYEQSASEISPILTEFIYPVGKFIEYLSGNSPNYSVTLFGRSGGVAKLCGRGII